MSSLSVAGSTKSLGTHERVQQYGENKTMDIGKCQRLPNKSNARINKLSAMRPGLTKIIENVCMSTYCERPQTDLHKAENHCRIEYTDTCSLKWVHWLSKRHSPHLGTSHYRCGKQLEFDCGVVWESLTIMRIHPRVAPESKILWSKGTLHNIGSMNLCHACHGRFEAIPILDPGDVK